MKKVIRLLAVLVTLSMVLALAACGGAQGPSSPTPGGTQSPAPTTPGSTPTPGGSDDGFADKPEVTLVLTQQDPDASLPGQFCHEWGKAVYEASRGRIKVDVSNGGSLAGPTESLGFVKDGIVDLAMGLQSFYPGQFQYSDGLTMPYLPYKDAVHASEVMWKIWEDTDILQRDTGYEGTKMILIRANADAPIVTAKKKLNTANDLKGLTIRATTKPLVTFLAELGATGQGCPITELFQNLQNGAFDGALTDWHAVNSFQLFETASYYADERIQFNSYFFLMNEDSYNSLSAENKKVIDDLSGPAALEILKGAWDQMKEDVRVKIDNQGGEVYALPPAEHQKLVDAADVAVKAYIAENGAVAQQLVDKIVELCRQ